MPVIFGISMVFSILLCVHVVRAGSPTFWLWIILGFQPLGGIIYLLTTVAPEILGGPQARRLGHAARQKLDPTREYRAAQAACEDAPTTRNQARLAAAAADLGRHSEAEALYAEAAQGIHAEDPALLLGRATALIELNRCAEALELLTQLGDNADAGRTPSAALAMGRAYDGLGRVREADTAYQWAAQRMPGFEGLGRYAAFMGRTGRKDEAREIIAEMDKRIAKTGRHFRKEAQAWRDFAEAGLKGA
jgi:hypothetical protein